MGLWRGSSENLVAAARSVVTHGGFSFEDWKAKEGGGILEQTRFGVGKIGIDCRMCAKLRLQSSNQSSINLCTPHGLRG